jgi:hypothetical protein
MIGAVGKEAMFLDTGDLDGDGLEDVVVATPSDGIFFLRRIDQSGLKFDSHIIPMPQRIGSGKAVTIGDIDGDGKPDLVITCEHAGGAKSGVVWLKCLGQPATGPWQRHEISGPQGTKYDLAPLLDLNGDRRLDVITTEENNNSKGGNGGLGVIWYENPHK